MAISMNDYSSSSGDSRSPDRGTLSPIAMWLRRSRKGQELTQKALANRVGCSVKLIQKLEQGERRPSRQIAQLLAHHLNIPEQEQQDFVKFARSVERGRRLLFPFGHSSPTSRTAIHLPAYHTSFIGRNELICTLVCALANRASRLLTLTGSPGVGKTRLGVEVVHTMQALEDGEYAGACFTDGICFVSLAPVSNPQMLYSAVAQALGICGLDTDIEVASTSASPDGERVIAYLREKEMLLVLDNCEHLSTAAHRVADMLKSCPRLYILATSREQLYLGEEREVRVPSLMVPTQNPGTEVSRIRRATTGAYPSVQQSPCPSVQLFVERTRAAQPDFELTLDNADAVTEICRQLDGVPLAIELAAARMKILTPHAILERLGRGLDLLTGGARDLSPRQHTMSSAIEWSYNLLDERERTLLCHLAAIEGSFPISQVVEICARLFADDRQSSNRLRARPERGRITADAADITRAAEGAEGALISAEGRGIALDLVRALVDKGLVQADERDGSSCFFLLTTMRRYAQEQHTGCGQPAEDAEEYGTMLMPLLGRS